MNMTIFIFLLFSLQFFYWLVGRRASKNVGGKEDYFLAGKNVKLFPLTMTFLATQVGGGLVLGAANEAFQFGWWVLLYPLGASLGLILLGSGIGSKLARFRVSTVAQIFEVFYGSKTLRRVASLLSILSLFMILVAQIIASNKFLVSLGLNNTPLFILFWAIVIIYTAQGGLRAVISTDLVQALFFSAIFLFVFGYVFYTYPIGIQTSILDMSQFSQVSSKIWGWLLMPLMFMVIEQDMGQRCFAGASSCIVSKAAWLAGLGTLVVCIVPVYFGTLGNHLGLEAPQGGSLLMAVIAATTNPWISALVGCAVLAAIISTATSLINAISSNLSNDFQISILKKVETMRWMQASTCVISIGAIFFAFYFDNIVDLLIQSYELSVSCLFIPIFIALFKRQGHFLPALLSILFGMIGFILFRIYPLDFPREMMSVALSGAGYCLGEMIIYYQISHFSLADKVN